MAAIHSLEQRKFIVRLLAAFATPDEVARRFAAAFKDTACAVDDVLRTDPNPSAGNIVDPDLLTLYLAERERVMLDPSSAPYAAQPARLIALSRDVEAYRSRGDIVNARAVLRQIAEETGVVGGKVGKVEPGAKQEAITEIRHVVVYPPAIKDEDK